MSNLQEALNEMRNMRECYNVLVDKFEAIDGAYASQLAEIIGVQNN